MITRAGIPSLYQAQCLNQGPTGTCVRLPDTVEIRSLHVFSTKIMSLDLARPSTTRPTSKFSTCAPTRPAHQRPHQSAAASRKAAQRLRRSRLSPFRQRLRAPSRATSRPRLTVATHQAPSLWRKMLGWRPRWVLDLYSSSRCSD